MLLYARLLFLERQGQLDSSMLFDRHKETQTTKKPRRGNGICL